jgi:hypothetical protein
MIFEVALAPDVFLRSSVFNNSTRTVSRLRPRRVILARRRRYVTYVKNLPALAGRHSADDDGDDEDDWCRALAGRKFSCQDLVPRTNSCERATADVKLGPAVAPPSHGALGTRHNDWLL